MILLITKYNLSPKWVQLLILLSIYFILFKMHYFDYNDNIAECTRGGRGSKITEVLFSEKPKECTTEKYLNEGCRIYTETGRIVSTVSQKASIDNKIERLIEVVSSHDETIAPLVAEAKTRNIHPADVLSGMLSSKSEAIPVVPDLSNYVTLEQHRLLENRLNEYLGSAQQLADSPTTASTQSLRSELNSNDLSSNIHLNELQKQLLELKKNQKGFYEAIENNIQPLSEELKSVSEKIKQMEEQLKSLSSLMGREKFEVLEERLRQLQALPEAPDGVITVQPGQNEGAPNRHLFELTDEMQEQIRQMALAEIERARNCCWRSIVNSWNGWRGNN